MSSRCGSLQLRAPMQSHDSQYPPSCISPSWLSIYHTCVQRWLPKSFRVLIRRSLIRHRLYRMVLPDLWERNYDPWCGYRRLRLRFMKTFNTSVWIQIVVATFHQIASLSAHNCRSNRTAAVRLHRLPTLEAPFLSLFYRKPACHQSIIRMLSRGIL